MTYYALPLTIRYIKTTNTPKATPYRFYVSKHYLTGSVLVTSIKLPENMPHKNTIRNFGENEIYHIYNRGVEKRNIFLDEQDYAVFMHLLKYYLSPANTTTGHPLMKFQNFQIIRPRPLANVGSQIELLVFCLMPNHFHFLIKQISRDGITKLLRRISTTYSMYFNKRYDRVGYLFQGRYKSILVDTDYYLLHLSRYIHINPLDLPGLTRSNLVNYPYSSYQHYLGIKHFPWVKPNMILSFYDKKGVVSSLKKYPSYKEFVEDYSIKSEKLFKVFTLE